MDTTLPYNSGTLYYRHSGKISPGGMTIAMVGGSAVAMLLGTVYAYADLYNPLAGWITFLVTGGTGFLMGLLIKKLILSGQIRNVPLALLLSTFLAGMLFVTAWEVWLYALLQRAGNPVDPLLLLDPRVVWGLLGLLYDQGAWTFQGTTVSGPALAIIWLAEAGCLLAIPIVMGWRTVKESPFCEHCQRWCGIREILNFNPGDKAKVIARLEQKDFSVLTELGKASPNAMHFWHATFQGCPDCDTTQTLSISDHVMYYDNKRRLQTKRKPVIRQLLLTPEDTVAVATAAAMLMAPPPTADLPTDTTLATPEARQQLEEDRTQL